MASEGGTNLCLNCVMDDTVPGIRFNPNGVCNFCTEAQKRLKSEKTWRSLDDFVLRVVKSRKKSKTGYDCIVGLSGGIDSCYVIHLLRKEYGLNPLAIHLDNGWNSDTAVQNISNLVRELEIDLETVVIDWDEFRAIQLAFLESGIKNCEIPTDHAILATLYHEAYRRDIKFVIHGGNTATESILPDSWMEDARDYRLLRSVCRRFDIRRFSSFPTLSLRRLAYYILVKKIKYVGILNFIEYDKKSAQKILEKNYDFRPYSQKHFESVFTKFFQSYFLPYKYGIDKRKAHLSSEICSGLITRNSALEKLNTNKPIDFVSASELDFVRLKLQLSHSDFQEILENRGTKFRFRRSPFIHHQRKGPIEMLRRIATNRRVFK